MTKRDAKMIAIGYVVGVVFASLLWAAALAE